MTHDPLCPRASHPQFCEGCTPQCGTCQCGLIATVRADTLDKAVQRVEQNVFVGMTLTPKEVRAVIAAVRAY